MGLGVVALFVCLVLVCTEAKRHRATWKLPTAKKQSARKRRGGRGKKSSARQVTAACNSPPSSPGDRRANKSRLVVGTFNAAWLFDGVNDPSGAVWANSSEADRHLAKVAEQIRRVSPDVLAMHEVESCAVLDRLVALLGSEYRSYLVPGTDTATQQNVALVTKIDPDGPLVRSSDRADTPVSGSTCGVSASGSSTAVSKHASVSIRASSFSFDFIFAHLKSGGLSTDCAQREGQATVLRGLVRPGVHTILAGDFNDWDDGFPDASNNVGTSLTLSLLKGSTMFNSGAQLPKANRSTSGVGLIDHLLVTETLRARLLSVSVDGSGYPTTSSGRIAMYLSDHLPVVLAFNDTAAASHLGDALLLCLLLLFFLTA